MGAAWRAPRCPVCQAQLWGRTLRQRFHCPQCRSALQSNADAATWAGLGTGLAVAAAVVGITRHLSGNWGVTLAFSEIAIILAYFGGVLAYQAVMCITRVRGT